MSENITIKSIECELIKNTTITNEYFILQFFWDFHSPRAGQFFMMKPVRSSVFLQRPISVFEYNNQQKIVKFLIAKRGKGTKELFDLMPGDKVFLTGPLGNTWAEFLPEDGKVALVGGSIGIAPLAALVAEKPDVFFHFFAGFKQGFRSKEEENAVMGNALNSKKLVISAEDGKNALIGRIADFIYEPQDYSSLFACGNIPMLRAIKKKCESKNVPCYISLESRFGCGVGACLGCTIRTVNGNRCCCKHGPIFPANEVLFDD
ncbi:MAG: dihydroorotate dehydrogenase electron transfer subunit [Treponema sp.]|nr:dihydroorotate dehydrogenase electron transfer subunit [Treponema sp.]MCL2250951.1 dihydroorotate dehydrogenase electron transfer subunit [Treponema sp.]